LTPADVNSCSHANALRAASLAVRNSESRRRSRDGFRPNSECTGRSGRDRCETRCEGRTLISLRKTKGVRLVNMVALPGDRLDVIRQGGVRFREEAAKSDET